MNITLTETNRSTSHFTSSDLALVTAISLFYPIETIQKENSRKAQFVFSRSTGFDELIAKYWKRELLIEPQKYFDQLKAIKNRLYANE